MKKTKLLCGLAVLFTVATQQVNAQSWNLNRNAGTAATNFIGTTDAKTLKIKTNNVTRMVVTSNGKIGIGNAGPVSRLDIIGSTTATDPVVSILGKYAGSADVIGLNVSSVTSDTGGIGLVANGNFIGVNGFGNGIGVEGALGGNRILLTVRHYRAFVFPVGFFPHEEAVLAKFPLQEAGRHFAQDLTGAHAHERKAAFCFTTNRGDFAHGQGRKKSLFRTCGYQFCPIWFCLSGADFGHRFVHREPER